MKANLTKAVLLLSTLTSVLGAECVTKYDTFCDSLNFFANRGTSARIGLLYWKPFTDGLEFAVTDNAFLVTATQGSSAVLDSDYRLKSIDQNSHLGCRVGLNQELCYTSWNIDLQWTHLQTHGTDRVNRTSFSIDGIPVPQPIGLLGQDTNDIWSMFDLGNTPLRMRGKINTNYDVIDLTLNNDFCICDCLTFRALFGIRGAVIVEELRVSYDNPFPNDFSGQLNFSKMKIKNNFSGLGPIIGIAPRYQLGMGFSLDGLFSASALLGRFDLDTHQKIVATGNQLDYFLFEIERDQHPIRIQPNIDIAANLAWDYSYCSCVDVRFSLGYEINYWTNFIRQNRITNTSSNPLLLGTGGKFVEQRHGDLAVHGLTFMADFSF